MAQLGGVGPKVPHSGRPDAYWAAVEKALKTIKGRSKSRKSNTVTTTERRSFMPHMPTVNGKRLVTFE